MTTSGAVLARLHRAAALLLVAGPIGAADALTLGITEGVTYRATDNQIEARFEAVADALAKATKQPVTIRVLSSYDAMRDALRRRQVDIAFIHPAHVALEAIRRGDYRSLAWTSGFTDYKVTLLCKSAQPITDWKLVAGKALVTPDADSITAVMTRAMLREHGLAPSSVKLQTTRYQDAVPFYVENGFAAYGATASRGVVKTWRDGGGKTCAESRGVPIKQWIASSTLDADTGGALGDALIGLAQTDLGRKALAGSTYAGFIAPSPEREKAVIDWLGL